MKTDIAVIILTYNEEKNMAQSLESVAGWAGQIFVLDSFSNDKTLQIAKEYDCHIEQNRFAGYSRQRNWALDNLPIKCEWVFFLDADEWVTNKMKEEISAVIKSSPVQNGFYIKFRLIWMGRWIKRGYYPSWVLRLFRRGKGRCGERPINEIMEIEGAVGYLREDLMHEDRKGIGDWITKHNGYATGEALELLKIEKEPPVGEARLFGNPSERKRWLRYNLWKKMPPIIRPFFYFFYRYVLKGGFMDGKEAFIYHFLQALWFQVLIDVKYLEMKKNNKRIGD